MLFEAQTGRTPFRGNNYPALAHSHIYENPPLPRTINANIPIAIENIILKALMKHPSQRFQNAREMRDALNQALKARNDQQQGNPLGGVINNVEINSGYYGQRPITPYQSLHQTPMDSRASFLHPCFNCQALNKPQMRYCTRCGYLLNQCTVCGSPNPVGNHFCTKCGQPLAAI
jgi:serine/threonine-protein kinase